MKKILLGAAIAAAFGTAGVANAAVDLDHATQNPLIFAQELTVPAAGIFLNVLAAGQNGGGEGTTVATGGAIAGALGAVETFFGFTIGQGTSKYVRLSFDQPLGAALAVSDFAVAQTAANQPATIAISQGGAAGDTFVVVEVSAPTNAPGESNDVLQNDKFIFAPAANKIKVLNKNTQNIDYALYETAVDAVAAGTTNRLAHKNREWIKFGPGYSLACSNGGAQIDVAKRHQFINAQTQATAATLALTQVNAFKADGTAVTLDNYFGTTPRVVVTGSAVGLTAALGANALTAATGNAGFNAITPAVATLAGPLVLTSNNVATTPMNASNYTVAITAGADALTGYGVGTLTANCGEVRFSGSTDRLDLALTPNGVFQQMVRITNPSSTAGAVTVTVINDAGTEVTFNLGSIAGVDNVLGAKASTKLININDVFAAAQAANPAFALAGTGADSKNKLRVVVRGEFGGDAVEGYAADAGFNNTRPAGNTLVERREDGIYIQAVTLSRDSNAFFQTK